ncbi:Ig-like domain-containing protein [Photobacterium damselae]|uniref:Ig-like domain-containing protein n=1 Tax=Photobacterium damselae TaxID=38293 RepID=UPI004067B52A
MNKLIPIAKILVLFFISLLLTACGGGDDGGDENTPSKEISISAQDTLKLSQFNNQTMIDLRSRVQAENNEPLLISNVKSINGDCDILSVDGLSFNVYSRHPDVCLFEYVVKPASGNYTGNAKALAQVIVNEDPKDGGGLPPISRTMLKGASIRFNSSDFVEPGYELDPSSVFALSGTGTSEIGKLSDISESGFTYQAPNTEAVVRIFYSVINKTDNIVRLGVIYIAIGQNINVSPNAQDRILENGTLLEKKIINIEDLVSDVDGDELQLIYARGVIGDVAISGNLELQYNPSSTGLEYITYIVSDHNGGYGIGLLEFDISTYRPILDITQQLIFLPPMTLNSSELAVSTGTYYEIGLDGFQGFYPIFTNSLASSYCITQGGRLPTEVELTSMWKNVINTRVFQSEFKWHSSLSYLTNTESKLVSLIDGQEKSSTDPAYFSCVVSTKDLSWEFSQLFDHTKLGVPINIIEIAHLSDKEVIYRDVKDFKLHAKVIKYLINGKVADPDDVNVTINGSSITIDADLTSSEAPYIQVEVTDDDIIDQSEIITVGVTQCEAGTTPEQALETACIYTVGVDNGTRFTLAIPTNIIAAEYQGSLDGVKAFGADGVSFITIKDPNTKEWHEYIQGTCDILNIMKVDGRTNWAPGMNMSDFSGGAREPLVSDDVDSEAMSNWLYYELNHDTTTEGTAPDYGQGFAGLVGQAQVVNQSGDGKIMHKQSTGVAYTPASCVSPN